LFYTWRRAKNRTSFWDLEGLREAGSIKLVI